MWTRYEKVHSLIQGLLLSMTIIFKLVMYRYCNQINCPPGTCCDAYAYCGDIVNTFCYPSVNYYYYDYWWIYVVIGIVIFIIAIISGVCIRRNRMRRRQQDTIII